MSADLWRCEACGQAYDLALRSFEVGMVRLAVRGAGGFRLGSAGIEAELEALLDPCTCGGRLVPDATNAIPGPGPALQGLAPELRSEGLAPLVGAGWAALEGAGDPTLERLRDLWRPRVLLALGRESELEPGEVLELRLEQRLSQLQDQIATARAAGDEDAAQMAHARYIELGTSYVRRFAAR